MTSLGNRESTSQILQFRNSDDPEFPLDPRPLYQDSEQEASIELYYNEIVEYVDNLFDISILIRKHSQKFRTSRAATHVEKDEQGIDLLLEFKTLVSLRIQHLYPRTPQWLVQRLADLVAKRRQQFCYQRAHKERLARIPKAYQDTAKRNTPREPTPQPKSSQPIKEIQRGTETSAPMAQAPTSTKSIAKTETTDATGLLLEDERLEHAPELLPRPTATEIGKSTFPNPPKSRGRAFECSQCFHMVLNAAREPRLWR